MTNTVAFSPVKPGLVAYAQEVLADGFFEGWFIRSTIENMLLAVYEGGDGYDSYFVGGPERFEANAAARMSR